MQLFPWIEYGPYRFSLKYKIPGINLTTSTYELELFNTVHDN